ncbi:Uncharacterised protein [Bordetella pertussis]|nr:Uncharacterised protein [Bordetella pertussis]CFW47288.1 Uncharacterised protein [Bordetella pertussis]CRE22622.1 Uncharacterised protein [Bordetella pertussis]
MPSRCANSRTDSSSGPPPTMMKRTCGWLAAKRCAASTHRNGRLLSSTRMTVPTVKRASEVRASNCAIMAVQASSCTDFSGASPL